MKSDLLSVWPGRHLEDLQTWKTAQRDRKSYILTPAGRYQLQEEDIDVFTTKAKKQPSVCRVFFFLTAFLVTQVGKATETTHEPSLESKTRCSRLFKATLPTCFTISLDLNDCV